ncbi:ABC-type glycerol-3-phosphate transport system substrate-binding protein [Anaerotaenia torta]|uniref:extracellular solute-binding protein n=1 Tax=Anaerotaenia torta TaxID=433293 RepID=UPI003D1B18AA
MGKTSFLHKRRGIALVLIITVAALNILTMRSAAPVAEAAGSLQMVLKESGGEENLLAVIHDTVSYEEYMETHVSSSYPSREIILSGGDYTEASEGFERVEGYEGFQESAVLTQEEGQVSWEAEVPEAGFYNIKLVYYPTKGKNNVIERELYINGEIPFRGAGYLEFSRRWMNSAAIEQDSRGNDVRPKLTEAPIWMEAFCKDSEGYYTEAYSFYFSQGKNTITIKSVKEPMAIGQIILTQEPKLPSYEEYIANVPKQEASLAEPIKIQGEASVFKSDSTLYPIPDRTSPLTEPYSASKTRLNVIGGNNWRVVGQSIVWEIEVPEDGLYEIDVKYRQNMTAGVTVVRSLKIDGQIPFKEAGELRFYYKNDWMIHALGEEKDPYQFYLEKGEHTLSLEVTLSEEMSGILNLTSSCITELNRAYRQLLMVIGGSPDTLRDYQLDKKTPEALGIIKEQYGVMQEISERVDSYARDSKGSQSAAIDNLLYRLKLMYEKPETIPKQWAAFKDNIVALGAFELAMREQPLEIDYLLLNSPGAKLPKAKAGFFQQLLHEIKAFLASFFEDYDSIGEVYEGKAIDVWILADAANVTSMSGSGRDQATVIKNLIDNYFTPEQQIPVNVKLVNKDVLLSATLAGRGPDVALNVAGREPVNYALRNAVVDLTGFEDFEDVQDWFLKDAFTQFTFQDGIYALPQTMSFHVMFYRADILKELNLQVPTNWKEFYECLAVIQKNNMNVGIVPDWTTYAMFLYQRGGSYYKDGGAASGLDTEAAVSAFQQWTGNYVNYRLPVTFDFANRFRTGEMPLAIGDYTSYNYLSVFAPEIKGLWGFTTVPGYEDAEGNMDHSVSAWETASIIMATSDQQKEAWQFLKWWMSDPVQTDYGNEIENVLGVAGRVATANITALKNLPWSNTDFRQLVKQLDWVRALPEVPGGYFTERHIKNAFYTVYNNKEDPRETLQDYVKTINNEIENKRKEFGLDTNAE